ncbi:cytochrome P450 [Streptomyces sp. NPDC045470]|uniref:cytochrome P450 n=1 Tax=unclassified Streptomyces TaxID=2593676 RepID=UPI003401391B
MFTAPERLDLGRRPNPHLTFGRGAHNCIGAHLARAELTVGLEALLDRFPHLHLAAGQSPTWDDTSPAKSPLTLPVDW